MFELQSPNSQITVRPGNIVKLNRFDDECWVVNLGWFSYAGNRPINGWYLVSTSHKDKVKPLNLSDLDDIYVVEIGEAKEDYRELDPKIKKLIHDLKVQVKDLQAQVAQLTVEIEAKDKVIEEKGQEILILQKQITDLAAEITALESQHNLDAETIETLNSQVRAQAEIIAEKAAEIRRLTTRVEELAAENEVLSQQHQEDLATIAQQSSTIQEQAQSIAHLTAENEELTSENDRLTDENAELVTQHEADVETISTQGETITQQGEQITELSGEVTELTNENTRLENQHEIDLETIHSLNERGVVIPIPARLQSKEIFPDVQTKYYPPDEGYDGFSSVTAAGATVEGLGLNENYYKLGEPFLDKVGTYHPFPENSYGGIYFTELNEDDFPVGIKVVNYDYNYNSFSIPALNMNTLRNNIKSFILLDCKNVNIGNSLFTGASLLTICQLDGVLTIDMNAFQKCTSLTEVNFPNSLTSIGQNAFDDCTSLTEVNFPNSLTSIGQNAFRYCSSLTNLTLAQGFNCNGLNVSWSTRLTAEIIVSCIEALADRTGEKAYTITFGTTNLNKLTAEQRAIATNKNWNLA